MSKYCSNCGKELNSNSIFCSNCGSRIEDNLNDENYDNSNNNRTFKTNNPILVKRDIATSIILSFITCGIYQIYWFINLTNDSNKASERPTDTSGGTAFLLTLITCGIYGIYWNYKMGQKIYEAGRKYNKQIEDNSVLYLILSLFGLQIVSVALMQSDLNKFAD